VCSLHAILIGLSTYLACWLRFDGDIPTRVLANFWSILPWIILIRGLTFLPLGLYDGLWRYTSVWDLSRIVVGVFVSSVILHFLVYQPFGPAGFPRSIAIIDSILLISFVGGVRLVRRIILAMQRSAEGQRVLIVGAGDAGEMIVREMRRGGPYLPVGFIDDDPGKVGLTIHGVTVLGTRTDLSRVIGATHPQEILVAIPSAKAKEVSDLVQQLATHKLPITTLPDLKELVNGKVAVKQIRPLAIEDLLPRSPVSLNVDAVRKLVAGKRILVTGAGGSIGSELCRQIAALAPASLILFERYENSLYTVMNDLADRAAHVKTFGVIGDVTDPSRVDSVFAVHQPQIVFHAAAHKHLPLMEANPCEAVKNNVGGTQTIAEAARHHAVECFVLISTDKAANPSSVMGATKRVAELIVQTISAGSRTRFVTVRFGNVLGSNGSVIPRMVEQIKAGGPVTVTHPEIRRYFMLIPEAVELVLQAAVLARNRETLVLDMGEQLKILDVARNLIRLSGYVPEAEIPIKFIGLRPGEKLWEELVGDGETLEPSEVSKIFRVRWPEAPNGQRLEKQVDALVGASMMGNVADTLALLPGIVPTFARRSSELRNARDDTAAHATRDRVFAPGVSQPDAAGLVMGPRLPRAEAALREDGPQPRQRSVRG
jgi:FlaA1/EpsC-like NDP-sugar epimerase